MTRNRVDVLENKSRSKNIRILNRKENNCGNVEQVSVTVDKIIQQTGVYSAAQFTLSAFMSGVTPPEGAVPFDPVLLL